MEYILLISQDAIFDPEDLKNKQTNKQNNNKNKNAHKNKQTSKQTNKETKKETLIIMLCFTDWLLIYYCMHHIHCYFNAHKLDNKNVRTRKQ